MAVLRKRNRHRGRHPATRRACSAHLANTYSDLIPKILGRGLTLLRSRSLLPRLVNRDYDGDAAQLGATINVPINPTMSAVAVTASAAQPSNTDTTFATTAVNLDKHYEVPFYLTDQQRLEIMAGTESKALDTAVATLSDYIDSTIMTAMDVGASIATGTAGTTPFATLALALSPPTYLDVHKTPSMDRHVVMSPLANANLVGLAGFTSGDYQGDLSVMTNGTFNGNNRAGARWWMTQQTPTHTAGTGASYLVNNGSGLAVGATTIACDTGAGTILAGDVVSFAADTANKYVVATALSGGSFTIAAPGLKVAVADNNAITVSGSHTANFAFQRESIVFASRRFAPSAAAIAMDQVTDPVTGLTLRVEVTRQNRQDRWAVDALWGTKVVQSQGVIKVMG